MYGSQGRRGLGKLGPGGSRIGQRSPLAQPGAVFKLGGETPVPLTCRGCREGSTIAPRTENFELAVSLSAGLNFLSFPTFQYPLPSLCAAKLRHWPLLNCHSRAEGPQESPAPHSSSHPLWQPSPPPQGLWWLLHSQEVPCSPQSPIPFFGPCPFCFLLPGGTHLWWLKCSSAQRPPP